MVGVFVEQYERVRRFYERFGALNLGRPHDVPSDNYLDDVYSFFINCYHLKDWIRNDAMLSKNVKDAVEPHINSSRSLKLCADICNSQKHLALTKPPRSGENPSFGAKRFALNLGAGQTTISLKWEVCTDNGPVDAYKLASDCVADWDAFLSSHGLR